MRALRKRGRGLSAGAGHTRSNAVIRPSAARFLVCLTTLSCNLGIRRSADVHALLLVPCPHQQRLPALSSAASSFSRCAAGAWPRGGGSSPAAAVPTVAVGARVGPPARLLVMQQTSGNWEEYFSGGGGGGGGGRGRAGGGGGGGGRDAAATGRTDGGGRGRSTSTARGRGGGGGGGGRSWGDDSRGGGYRDRGSGRGGMRGGGRGRGRGRGGRSDFDRGRGWGGRGASAAYYDRGGGFSSRGGPASGRGRGRSRAAGRSGPGYNMDDFELVEEGTGDDGSWDDFSDFSDDPGQYMKPRGADTAYVEDLGTELKVTTGSRAGSFSAAPPADAVLGADPNLTPVSGGLGLGRSHNRERRAAQRERGRRELRDSEKGRSEGGRLWSEDDGAADAAAAAAATRVRDGAQLRVKRREARERAERERQAAYFASLDEGEVGTQAADGGGNGDGGAGFDGGLNGLFGDYFSPEKSPPPPPRQPQASPPQRFSRQASPTAASSWDQLPQASSADGGGGGGRVAEWGGGRGGRTSYDEFPDQGQESGGRLGRKQQGRAGAGRGGDRGRGGGDFERYERGGDGGGGRAAPSHGRGGGKRGRVVDNSIWDADRWESTGSTAWASVGEGDGGAGGGKGSLPSWKVPKAGAEAEKTKSAAPVPEWLPKHGGLGSKARQGVAPLPEGIDTSVKKLGVKGLEAMLKAKFSKMKEGVFAGEDDDVDFYDPDDEGFERPPDVGEQLPLFESEEDAAAMVAGAGAGGDIAAAVQEFRGAVRYDDPDAPRPKGLGVVARSEAEAAGGGFRMRSPARAAAAAAAAAANTPGEDDEVVRSPLEVEGLAGSAAAAGAKEGGKVKQAGAVALEEPELDAGKSGKEKKTKPKPDGPKPVYAPININDMETLEQQGAVSFRDLGIEDKGLLANIKGLGITSPTDVQVSAIRGLLSEDRDVIIHAHTGSGKTLAYLLPLIAATDPASNAVQAIVVAPGRELASQIFSVYERLTEGSGLRSAMIIGGANALRQVERVKKVKPQIVVATPGRLCELVFDRRRMKLGMVRTVVLDEVDALLRPPYDQEIDAIMDATPRGRRQAVFASATGRSPVVSAASQRYMRDDPVFVGGGGGGAAGGGGPRRGGLPSNILHTIVTMPKVKKFDTLRRLLNTQPFPESVMIFVNDPIQVNWLTERLETVGIIAAPLSGESSKDDRAEIMRRLQDKRIAMVVTTEMAARGLDVAHLTHVVNYDLPTDADHYVHRAGRCGRAGRPGIVVNMATPDVKFVLGKFSRSLGVPFDDCEIQGGRFWSVSRTEPPPAVSAVSAARAEVAAAKEAVVSEKGVDFSTAQETAVAAAAASAAAAGVASGPTRRRGPSSPADKGFLGHPVTATTGRGGGNFDKLSLGDDGVDDDILAEAKAFLEGGGAGAAAERAAATGSFPPSPGEEELEDDGDVFIDDVEDAAAEAATFLGGGGGDTGGGAAAVAAGEALLPKRASQKEKRPRADAGSGAVSTEKRAVGETFEVAGGLAIVHTADPEDVESEEEWDGGEWDEDDWGDGDWGDEEEGEEDEEDADTEKT